MNSNVQGKSASGNRPPIPIATFPDVTEEFPSIEAKVWKAVDETSSIGATTKKKNKRSAHTAAIESSPTLRPLITTHTPSNTVMTDAMQNQINTTSDASLVRITAPTVPLEIDGMIPGGTLWEDPFGGMTLDEDVVEQQVGVVAMRPRTLDDAAAAAVSFPSMQTTPVITRQQYSANNTIGSIGFQETPSPLDNVNHLVEQSNLSQGAMQHPAKVILSLSHPHPPTLPLSTQRYINTLLTHPINTSSVAYVISFIGLQHPLMHMSFHSLDCNNR
jgi:hypothetical protein